MEPRPYGSGGLSQMENLQAVLDEYQASQLRAGNIEFATVSEQNVAPAVVSIIKNAINTAIEKRGRAAITLSGGRAPRAVYKQLKDVDIDWAKVDIFWGDERPPRPDVGQTNYELAYETFLKDISIPQENIHRIDVDSEDYEGVASEYARTIDEVIGEDGKFDLMLTGGGGKGQLEWHIMGIMPNSEVFTQDFQHVGIVSREDTGFGYTLTPEMLTDRASFVVGLFPTQEKKYVIDKLLEEAESPVVNYPVTLLKKRAPGTTLIVTDQPLNRPSRP